MKIEHNVASKKQFKYSLKDDPSLPPELEGEYITYDIYSFEDEGKSLKIYHCKYKDLTQNQTLGWKDTHKDGLEYGNYISVDKKSLEGKGMLDHIAVLIQNHDEIFEKLDKKYENS